MSLLVEVRTPEVNTRAQMTEATRLRPMIQRPWREVSRAGRVATTNPRTSPSSGSANAVMYPSTTSRLGPAPGARVDAPLLDE